MTTIRPAVIEDGEMIAALLQQLGYARSAGDIAPIIAATQGDGIVLVAVDEGGQVVGCLQALVDTRLAEGQRGEITSLVVAAEVRSQGIGAELVAAVTQWLQSRGIGRLRVRCNTVRERAHQFCEKHGFELTKTQKVFDIHFAAAKR